LEVNETLVIEDIVNTTPEQMEMSIADTEPVTENIQRETVNERTENTQEVVEVEHVVPPMPIEVIPQQIKTSETISEHIEEQTTEHQERAFVQEVHPEPKASLVETEIESPVLELEVHEALVIENVKNIIPEQMEMFVVATEPVTENMQRETVNKRTETTQDIVEVEYVVPPMPIEVVPQQIKTSETISEHIEEQTTEQQERAVVDIGKIVEVHITDENIVTEEIILPSTVEVAQLVVRETLFSPIETSTVLGEQINQVTVQVEKGNMPSQDIARNNTEEEIIEKVKNYDVVVDMVVSVGPESTHVETQQQVVVEKTVVKEVEVQTVVETKQGQSAVVKNEIVEIGKSSINKVVAVEKNLERVVVVPVEIKREAIVLKFNRNTVNNTTINEALISLEKPREEKRTTEESLKVKTLSGHEILLQILGISQNTTESRNAEPANSRSVPNINQEEPETKITKSIPSIYQPSNLNGITLKIAA
ncbi:MAG: hypothetical protein Q7K54_01310, partial [Candidatus Parcubacteria bacterium]|nr:hypothetical protein [Candidatus Parcubacteria bacterium]